jgi:hypothetical protein
MPYYPSCGESNLVHPQEKEFPAAFNEKPTTCIKAKFAGVGFDHQ